MKILTIIVCLGLSMVPAFGQSNQGNQGGNHQGQNGGSYHGAPAPLIGFGIPSGIAAGGVLLGAKLLRQRRRKSS
jgi:hypothetical protein